MFCTEEILTNRRTYLYICIITYRPTDKVPRQLPHTGGDAVCDMKRHGPTTQDNQEGGEPNVSFSGQTPGLSG